MPRTDNNSDNTSVDIFYKVLILINFRSMRWLFLLTILCITGCKKRDEVPPEVVMELPYNQAHYQYGDVIPVKASVSDNQSLFSIEVSLVNADQQVVMPTRLFHPEEAVYSLSMGFELNDVRLETGTYFVRVRASDGEHTQNEFREVHITGAAKAVKEILFVEQSGGTYNLSALNDTTGNTSLEWTIGQEFLCMVVNSWDQVVGVSGHTNEDFVAIDWESKFEKWREQVVAGVSVSMIAYDDAEHLFFIGKSDGKKMLKYKSGTTALTLTEWFGTLFEPQAGAVGSDFVACYELDHVDGADKLNYYDRETGVHYQSRSLTKEIDYLAPRNNQEFLAVSDQGGALLEVDVVNAQNNTLINLYSSVNTSINDVVQIDANTLVLATSTGVYVYAYGGAATQISTQVAQGLDYDTVNQRLAAIGNNNLVLMDLAGNTLNSFPVNGGVEVAFLYNK